MKLVVAEVIQMNIGVFRVAGDFAMSLQRGRQPLRIMRHAAGRSHRGCVIAEFHFLIRRPKSAVPTRMQVEPSSTAASKSCDMPIESSASPC